MFKYFISVFSFLLFWYLKWFILICYDHYHYHPLKSSSFYHFNFTPRGFDARTEETPERHDQAIQERDNQIQTIPYESIGLQHQIETRDQCIEKCEVTITDLRECYVDHAKDPGKYNIIIIVQKCVTFATNKYHDLLYYVSGIQRHKKYIKLILRLKQLLTI